MPWLLVLPLLGCAPDDFSRPGTWRATGANDENLRAMLAEPSHATYGAGAATERGQAGSLAIQRLRGDRRRPLPESRASTVGAVPAGGPPAPTPEPDRAR